MAFLRTTDITDCDIVSICPLLKRTVTACRWCEIRRFYIMYTTCCIFTLNIDELFLFIYLIRTGFSWPAGLEWTIWWTRVVFEVLRTRNRHVRQVCELCYLSINVDTRVRLWANCFCRIFLTSLHAINVPFCKHFGVIKKLRTVFHVKWSKMLISIWELEFLHIQFLFLGWRNFLNFFLFKELYNSHHW